MGDDASLDFVERILQEIVRSGGNLTAAEAVGLARGSRVRVRRTFRERTGMNFRTARLHAKMARASELLLTTSKTLPEIAEELGYSDRSKLEKPFKKVFNMTPTQFRDRIRLSGVKSQN